MWVEARHAATGRLRGLAGMLCQPAVPKRAAVTFCRSAERWNIPPFHRMPSADSDPPERGRSVHLETTGYLGPRFGLLGACPAAPGQRVQRLDAFAIGDGFEALA